MDIFSIDVTLNELVFIRQSLDIVTVSGKDAKFLAGLQYKVEQNISEITAMLQQQEDQKQKDLQQLIESEQKKGSSKK
jgi:hypothetical protein